MVDSTRHIAALLIFAIPDQLQFFSAGDSFVEGAHQLAFQVEDPQFRRGRGVFKAESDGGAGIEGVRIVLFQQEGGSAR
jgi:hypothetical protein